MSDGITGVDGFKVIVKAGGSVEMKGVDTEADYSNVGKVMSGLKSMLKAQTEDQEVMVNAKGDWSLPADWKYEDTPTTAPTTAPADPAAPVEEPEAPKEPTPEEKDKEAHEAIFKTLKGDWKTFKTDVDNYKKAKTEYDQKQKNLEETREKYFGKNSTQQKIRKKMNEAIETLAGNKTAVRNATIEATKTFVFDKKKGGTKDKQFKAHLAETLKAAGVDAASIKKMQDAIGKFGSEINDAVRSAFGALGAARAEVATAKTALKGTIGPLNISAQAVRTGLGAMNKYNASATDANKVGADKCAEWTASDKFVKYGNGVDTADVL